MSSNWYVYMVRCIDNSLYTGITTDLERRVNEHNTADKLAAKYTRHRRPVELVYHKNFDNRSAASKQEYLLKKLTKKQKEQLILDYN